MKTLLATALVVAALSTTGTAQTTECVSPCTILQGEALTVYTEVKGEIGFRLLVNGVLASVSGQVLNGVVEFRYPQGLAAGTYSMAIELLYSDGSKATTEAGSLTVLRRKVKFRR